MRGVDIYVVVVSATRAVRMNKNHKTTSAWELLDRMQIPRQRAKTIEGRQEGGRTRQQEANAVSLSIIILIFIHCLISTWWQTHQQMGEDERIKGEQTSQYWMTTEVKRLNTGQTR